MANIDVACIKAIADAEANGGRLMTTQERKLFKIGFLAGAMQGIEIAKAEIDRLAPAKAA